MVTTVVALRGTKVNATSWVAMTSQLMRNSNGQIYKNECVRVNNS